jgi:hypothetical protein
MCGARINLAAVTGLKALGHKKRTTMWKTMKIVATMILRKMGGETMIMKNPILTVLIHSQYMTG